MKTAALVTASLTCCAIAFADGPANPSFESGAALADWTVSPSGIAATSTAAPAAPTEGNRCVLLTSRATTAAQLATFLGCTTAAMQAAAGTNTTLTDGCAIKQSFVVAAGDTLTFDFAFNNAEDTNNLDWPDTAFVVINGVPTKLASSAQTPHGWTAVQTFSKTDLTEGSVTVSFVVCNFADFSLDSQLMVDNVRIESVPILAVCGAADLGKQGGQVGFDNHLDNNDFIAFISLFFANDAHADLGVQGGLPGSDGAFDNNDFIAFISAFFDRAGENGC
ncbi:MAG: GC-type dockerin domain-anchored protein [Phycisphaerales bacterium]